MYPIVRHIKTNIIYFYKGNNVYQNTITNVEGIVDESKASSVFKINLDATELINQYPNLKLLVEGCELRLDPLK